MMPVLHLLRELSKSQCWKKENKYTHTHTSHIRKHSINPVVKSVLFKKVILTRTAAAC